MATFDEKRIELSRHGWEIELSSVVKQHKRKGVEPIGHCLALTNVISTPSNNHHNYLHVGFNFAKDADKSMDALALLAHPLQNDVGLAASIKLYQFEDYAPIEKRDPVLQDGMTYLEVYEEMLAAGWEYFDELYSPNQDLVVRTAQFYTARWNGKKLKPALTFTARSTSLEEDWDARVLQLARQVPLFSDEKFQPLNRASAY